MTGFVPPSVKHTNVEIVTFSYPIQQADYQKFLQWNLSTCAPDLQTTRMGGIQLTGSHDSSGPTWNETLLWSTEP